MVNVLPVPALASSRVTPLGRGPQTSKGWGAGPRRSPSRVDQLLVASRPSQSRRA